MKNALRKLLAEVQTSEDNSKAWKEDARKKMADARALTRIIQKSEPGFQMNDVLETEEDSPADDYTLEYNPDTEEPTDPDGYLTREVESADNV